jgi:hypothetical protein
LLSKLYEATRLVRELSLATGFVAFCVWEIACDVIPFWSASAHFA